MRREINLQLFNLSGVARKGFKQFPGYITQLDAAVLGH